MDRLNSKMTAIADEIRELNGGNEKLDLDAMANDVREGNEEIALQRELIEQALTALNGKVDPELYDKGYEDGYKVGEADGEVKGRTEGEQIGFSNALEKRTELTVAENGEYIPEGESTGFSKVNVSVVSVSKLPQLIDRSVMELTAEDLNGITAIGDYAFYRNSNLISVEIPDSVTSIGKSAFTSCEGLTSFTIPNGVRSIGGSAFDSCTGLQSLTIPVSVTEIGTYAFRSCTGLTSIIIPAGVTYIAGYTFSYCSAMQYYDFTSHTKVPNLGNKTAFQDIPPTCEIRVPEALAEEWKAATNWSTYASQIVGV